MPTARGVHSSLQKAWSITNQSNSNNRFSVLHFSRQLWRLQTLLFSSQNSTDGWLQSSRVAIYIWARQEWKLEGVTMAYKTLQSLNTVPLWLHFLSVSSLSLCSSQAYIFSHSRHTPVSGIFSAWNALFRCPITSPLLQIWLKYPFNVTILSPSTSDLRTSIYFLHSTYQLLKYYII